MAMAVKSSLVHSGISSGIQAPECWSTTGWEHETPTDSWEWEDPTMNYSSRQGEGHLRMQNNDWPIAACSAVTLATSVGASKSGEFSLYNASGSRTPSGTSVSSAISGVAGGRGSSGAGFSSLVKIEPDERGVEQVVAGAPVSSSGQSDDFLFSLGRSQSWENEGRTPVEADHTQPTGGQSNGNSVVSGGGDCQNAALKLGRRSHCENSAAGGRAKASSPALSPPGKKQRALSPSAQVPRCQVEGCKADLSGCKDYHKRHKVCEMHSKAPTAIAAGIEQRFCQQCSRFHVLKEFDEGKRSCRRRLAGHNERRRKPHQETHSIFGIGSPFLHREISTSTIAGTPFYFPEDSKQSSLLHPDRGSPLEYGLHAYNHNLTRSSLWSLKSRDDNVPTFELQNSKSPVATSQPSSALNLGGHHFLEGPLGPLGKCLSLSSSTAGVLGSLEHSSIGSCSQSLSNVSGMMDSGRALSLLSSQSWASRPPPGAPAPVSLDLPQVADSTLEQLVASSNDSSNRESRFSHHLQLPPGVSSARSSHQEFGKHFSTRSGGPDFMGLSCGLTATGNGTHQYQVCGNGNSPTGLGGYDETNSMLGLCQAGQDIHALNPGSTSHHARPTMDLMQMPSIQAHHVSSHSNGLHSQASDGQYSGFSSLRPFESAIFSSQQLL